MKLHHPLFLLALLVGCDDTKDGGISSGGEAVDAGSNGDDGGSGSGDEGGSGSGAGTSDGSGTGDSGGSGGSGGTGGSGSGSGEDCWTEVADSYPEDGAADWYYRSPLEVYLSEPDPTATVTLEQDGTPVSGTVEVDDDGQQLRFTPDALLSPSTAYTLAVTVCGGDVASSLSFTTSDLGTPLACDLDDHAYVLDHAGGRYVEPRALAELLFESLEDNLIVGLTGNAAGGVDAQAARSDGWGGRQDYCLPSIDLTTSSWTDPTFVLDPVDVVLPMAGLLVPVEDLTIAGSVAADCSRVGGVSWTGALDARALGPLLGELLGSEDPDEICVLFESFGVECAACTDDGAPYCVPVKVTDIEGEDLGVGLSCVSEVDCHPGCPTTTCEDPSVGVCD